MALKVIYINSGEIVPACVYAWASPCRNSGLCSTRSCTYRTGPVVVAGVRQEAG